MNIIRTNSKNKGFQQLIKELDNDLNEINGEEQAMYDAFNKVDNIKHVIVIYENENPIACGAIKEIAEQTMEIKRMFVKHQMRNRGLASKVLSELEIWAKELGFSKLVLETGEKQISAIELYKKNKFHRIENYGEYVGLDASVCFGKSI